FGADLLVTCRMGFVLRRHHDVPRPLGEPAESLVGIEIRWLAGTLRNETLLSCLFGDPHAPADLRPGRARASCLVDEVADQMVSDVAEVIRGDDRVRKLFENVRVHLLDGLDQVVEPDWIRHTDWILQANAPWNGRTAGRVNHRLSVAECQPQ